MSNWFLLPTYVSIKGVLGEEVSGVQKGAHEQHRLRNREERLKNRKT